MKVSTKGRYALRMLLDLSQNQHKGFIALKDIAERQGISKKYLEQIVTLLNRADVLTANRGSQGGYRLAKPPRKYTVGEVLRITEGSIAPITGLADTHKSGESREMSMMVEVWRGLEKTITGYLESVTLQDIIDRYDDSGSFDYSI